MNNINSKSNASTHLKSVRFELHYPASPFFPRTPVFAEFSEVLNSDDKVYAKLDSGSITDTTSQAGIPISGFFTVESNEARWRFSGTLCDNRIVADAEPGVRSAPVWLGERLQRAVRRRSSRWLVRPGQATAVGAGRPRTAPRP